MNLLSGKLSVICDTDGVLHAAGEGKKELEGKLLSPEMDKVLKERRSYMASVAESGDIVPVTHPAIEGVTSQIIVPIISGGDCIGAVALLSKEAGEKMDSNLLNLVRLTAEILANHFE